MNTVKIIWDIVKSERKLQWMLAAMFLVSVGAFVIFFGKSIGLETNIKDIIVNGLYGISCLIFFFVTEKEKNKYFYLFMFGFFSAFFLMPLVDLLGYS